MIPVLGDRRDPAWPARPAGRIRATPAARPSWSGWRCAAVWIGRRRAGHRAAAPTRAPACHSHTPASPPAAPRARAYGCAARGRARPRAQPRGRGSPATGVPWPDPATIAPRPPEPPRSPRMSPRAPAMPPAWRRRARPTARARSGPGTDHSSRLRLASIPISPRTSFNFATTAIKGTGHESPVASTSADTADHAASNASRARCRRLRAAAG